MTYPFRKILITGGCGFMGSNFIRFLYNSYPELKIYNLDALTYAGNPDNLIDISKDTNRYFFIHGNICDKDLVNDIVSKENFDVIYHFAAESHVDRSFVSDTDFIKTNEEGTRTLLDAVRKYGVERFVHISTDEVYGSVSEGNSDEQDAFNPSSPYAASKAAADLMVQSYIKMYNLPAIIIRSANNYGPFQYPEKLIPLVITNLLENKKIPVHGSGKHIRCWVHVDDFCRGTQLATEKASIGHAYNISGEPKTNLEIIYMISKELGKNADEYINFVNDRPASDMRYSPGSSKLEKETGWSRKYSLESVIKQEINWYTKNKQWWEKIKRNEQYLDHYKRQSNGQWF